MITLLIVIALLCAANAVMTAVLFKKQVDRLTADSRERDIENALELARRAKEAEAEAERRERETSAAFDEGIENIMAYAVKGKTGLEPR